MEMRYKDFGKTGLRTSVISVGTWGIGGYGWGGADRDSSIGTIRAMIDNGANLIDAEINRINRAIDDTVG
jgi:aryl-alcohol dehydrogenase-like predicted oxidoreductase